MKPNMLRMEETNIGNEHFPAESTYHKTYAYHTIKQTLYWPYMDIVTRSLHKLGCYHYPL